MHRPSTSQEPSGSRRALSSLVLVLAALFVVWTIRATVMMPIDQSIPSGVLRLLYSIGIKLAIWVLPSWWMARRADPGHPCRYLRITTPVR